MAAPDDKRDSNIVKGVDEAYAVIGLLLSGLIVCGGIGLGIDALLDLHYLFLPIGILVGLAVGTYMVVAKYGGLSGDKGGR
jgi:F0F1-type ATP synthase assembly protein I